MVVRERYGVPETELARDDPDLLGGEVAGAQLSPRLRLLFIGQLGRPSAGEARNEAVVPRLVPSLPPDVGIVLGDTDQFGCFLHTLSLIAIANEVQSLQHSAVLLQYLDLFSSSSVVRCFLILIDFGLAMMRG